MNIYLTRPGGQREGPYTLDQINRDIAAGKYSDQEFWAWHEGMAGWEPLYAIPGVGQGAAPNAEPQAQPAPPAQPPAAEPELSSGLPFAALDQIFIFTTADGRSAFESERTVRVLEGTVGMPLDGIRRKLAVDVIGKADAEALRSMREGSIPPAVWRAIEKIKPDIAQPAQDGVYRVCLRTFASDAGEVTAMFLLYHKQKLNAAADTPSS